MGEHYHLRALMCLTKYVSQLHVFLCVQFYRRRPTEQSFLSHSCQIDANLFPDEPEEYCPNLGGAVELRERIMWILSKPILDIEHSNNPEKCPCACLGSERGSCPRRTREAMLRLLARGLAGLGPSLLVGTARGTSCAREPAGGPAPWSPAAARACQVSGDQSVT